MMKLISLLLATLIALTSVTADATIKKKNKKNLKKSTQIISPYVISIGYPTTIAAFNAVQARSDVVIKSNAKPFGWQRRNGPWYVVNEKPNLEWAFTEAGHYAHPSVIKRMIDIGSSDHVYVDMAFRCGAANKADCDTLLTEFKEVNLFINKVYQKKYIVTADGKPAWIGVDSLD